MFHSPTKPKIAISACLLHPDLPVEEDGGLNDPVLRENFLTRASAYNAWQQLCQEGLTRRGLTDFHSRYKYLLMAHNPVQYKTCLLYTSPSPRDRTRSRMPSSA